MEKWPTVTKTTGLRRRAYVFSALEHKGQVRHSASHTRASAEVADSLADMSST